MYGRKSGRGYYDYGGVQAQSGAAYRPEDPAPFETGAPAGGEGVVVVAGDGTLAEELRAAATSAGYEVRAPHAPTGGVLPSLVVDCEPGPARRGRGAALDGARPDRRGSPPSPQGGARLVLCARGSLGVLDPDGSSVGFHVLPPLEQAGLVELTRGE